MATRFEWVATLPVIDIPSAVAEIEFARANCACGIFLRGLIEDKRLSHPSLFPIYAAAEKAGLPVCVHASTGNFDWMEMFDGESGFMRFKAPVLSGFHSIVHDGVPKRFPNLKFASIEVRAQWIPYMVIEIARRFERADNAIARNLIRDNHVWVTCQTDDDLPQVLKYSGEDNIIIGSDYGHNDTSSEIEALLTIKQKGEVEPRIIDKILYDNDAGFLGDDLPSDRYPNTALLARALERLRPGDITMMHLGVWQRREPLGGILRPLIQGLKAKGLCLAPLPLGAR